MSAPAKSGSTTINGEGTYSWTITPLDSSSPNVTAYGWNDQRFRIVIQVPSGISDLDLRMTSTLNQSSSDESWGIDNFSVTPTNTGVGPTGHSLAAVAIADYSRNASQGEWQWSSDGNTWNNIPNVANPGLGIVINADDEIRFQPALNFNGTAPSLSVSFDP